MGVIAGERFVAERNILKPYHSANHQCGQRFLGHVATKFGH